MSTQFRKGREISINLKNRNKIIYASIKCKLKNNLLN